MATLFEHKWGIRVPRSEITGQPTVIAPFETHEEATAYLAATNTEQDCAIIPVVPPHDDPSDDAVFEGQ